MNADDLAFHLTLTRMSSVEHAVELNYSDGSMITVNAAMDESTHYLNGSLGNLMPVSDLRIYPQACPQLVSGLQGWLTTAHCSEEQRSFAEYCDLH
jgi:hypothetical protein